jgi:8-oxo-dGTP diphosphatase
VSFFPAQLQFGKAEPSLSYRDRPAAFGVAEREGRIALVRITKPGFAPWLDLPGGALDPGEDASMAVVREFGEETGLVIRPTTELGRADQFLRNTEGQTYNNRSTLFRVETVSSDPRLKIEDDHELVWLEPLAAIGRLRHDSHAWAVALWLRESALDRSGSAD